MATPTPKELADFDQGMASLADTAAAASARYFRALISAGMPQDASLQLTQTFIAAWLTALMNRKPADPPAQPD